LRRGGGQTEGTRTEGGFLAWEGKEKGECRERSPVRTKEKTKAWVGGSKGRERKKVCFF